MSSTCAPAEVDFAFCNYVTLRRSTYCRGRVTCSGQAAHISSPGEPLPEVVQLRRSIKSGSFMRLVNVPQSASHILATQLVRSGIAASTASAIHPHH